MVNVKENIEKIDPQKQREVRACIEVVKRNKDVRRLIVFGSAARQQCDENSDLDLCIELNINADKLAYHYTVADIGKICKHNYDLLNYNRLNDDFKDFLEKQGVVVYELP